MTTSDAGDDDDDDDDDGDSYLRCWLTVFLPHTECYNVDWKCRCLPVFHHIQWRCRILVMGKVPFFFYPFLPLHLHFHTPYTSPFTSSSCLPPLTSMTFLGCGGVSMGEGMGSHQFGPTFRTLGL